VDRGGQLRWHTDEDEQLQGRTSAQRLIDEWDLWTDVRQARVPYVGAPGPRAAKLIHHVVFSMPEGTSAWTVLAATQALAREQFAGRHRYAMVLHTDREHPHVHLVVRAAAEHGQRLNVTRATLRSWREEFARALQARGVESMATHRTRREPRTTTSTVAESAPPARAAPAFERSLREIHPPRSL
jgi:hypothetical protein